MDEKRIEENMKEDIESIFSQILKEHNYIFPISAKSRSGAEISDYLEDGFVEYLTRNPHQRIYNPGFTQNLEYSKLLLTKWVMHWFH